jgi:hypothetical protein
MGHSAAAAVVAAQSALRTQWLAAMPYLAAAAVLGAAAGTALPITMVALPGELISRVALVELMPEHKMERLA